MNELQGMTNFSQDITGKVFLEKFVLKYNIPVYFWISIPCCSTQRRGERLHQRFSESLGSKTGKLPPVWETTGNCHQAEWTLPLISKKPKCDKLREILIHIRKQIEMRASVVVGASEVILSRMPGFPTLLASTHSPPKVCLLHFRPWNLPHCFCCPHKSPALPVPPERVLASLHAQETQWRESGQAWDRGGLYTSARLGPGSHRVF